MKTQSASNLRYVFTLACLVLSFALVGSPAFAQDQQSMGMSAPQRNNAGTCLMPIRPLESSAETSLAYGNSGEFLAFDHPFFKAGFGLYELPAGYNYFGFKGETTGSSFARGYSRNVEVLNACNTMRRVTIKCAECSFITGDQTGGDLTVTGLEIVRTFEKRSGGWAMICDVSDKFRIDYFGLSKWPDADDPSKRVGFSAHDGGVWQKFPNRSDEFRKSDLHCPVVLNTGTIVELDWSTVLTGELQYAVFHIRNDASSTQRAGDVADWFAFWARMW